MLNENSYRLPRFKVFIDYWNFQLLVNEIRKEDKVKIDWKILGEWLSEQSSSVTKIKPFSYEGANIYTSYNPKKEKNTYYKWINNWLNKQPGIQVFCSERQTKRPPTCPCCYKLIENCPHCKDKIIGTVEKGVDALIVTDMIRLAWEDAYDVAILASSDRDLIPCVKFLENKGKKVIHAGFPPIGSDLSQSCWASFDIVKKINEIVR